MDLAIAEVRAQVELCAPLILPAAEVEGAWGAWPGFPHSSEVILPEPSLEL